MGAGMGTEQGHKGVLDRDSHKPGPWLELLPCQTVEETSWSDDCSWKHNVPWAPTPVTDTDSVECLCSSSLSRITPGQGTRHLSLSLPFSPCPALASAQLSIVPFPTSVASSLPSPRTQWRHLHPPISASPRTETTLFLGVN